MSKWQKMTLVFGSLCGLAALGFLLVDMFQGFKEDYFIISLMLFNIGHAFIGEAHPYWTKSELLYLTGMLGLALVYCLGAMDAFTRILGAFLTLAVLIKLIYLLKTLKNKP